MDPFIYVARHQTIICTTCRHAVTASQVQRHIQDTAQHHTDWPGHEARKRVVETFENKETVEIKDLVIPSTTVRSVEGLEVFIDGLMCDSPDGECRFIARAVKAMMRHCRKDHGWTNPKGKGRPAKGSHRSSASQPWKSGIKCQQFFKTGPKSQLFKVRLAAEEDEQIQGPLMRRAGTRDEDWKRRMEEDRRHTRELMEKVERDERDLVHKAAKGEINAWVERTGWARYLEGQRRSRLVPLIAKPDEDIEPELAEIGRRFDKIITVAQKTIIMRVNTFTRMQINRKDIHTEGKKPFNATMEPDTLTRYREEFKCVIRFILRIWMREQRTASEASSSGESSEEEEDDGEPGNEEEDDERPQRRGSATQPRKLPKKLPSFKMGGRQHDLTSWLITEIKGCVGEEERVEVAEEEDPEIQTGRLDHINRILVRWCIELFNHEMGGAIGDDFDSPVIAALAIVGIRSNGAWMSALSYTPKLSAIVKMMRLVVVQHAWEVEADGSKENRLGLLQHTRKMVEGFMTTHEPTPMKWIHDVRRYGLKIRMTTTSPGTVRWIGDRLQYQNIEFRRLEFQGFVHGLVDKAQKTLMEDILLFMDEEEQRDRLPAIPWATLRDNPAEDEPGWCFMDDRRNEWPVDGKSWLEERIWSDEVYRRMFIRPDESAEGVGQERRGHPWKREAVARWMRLVVYFKELLLLLMHITGGGPARAPEILSVRYRNTANGGLRNIYVENEMVAFVTEYHKGYGLSGQGKIIYRYLPREVGELLVWYVWLVLPLQQQFEVVVKKATRLQPFLWSSQGDMDGRKWTGERMKRMLVRETGEGMGVALTIADYRQCAAAIVDKYLGRQEGFDEETVEGAEDEEDEEGCWWDADDRAEHLQFAHTTHEATVGYARGIEESGITTMVMRLQWRQVSEKWHRHLRFPSAMGSGGEWDFGGRGRPGRASGVEADWEEEDRKAVMRQWKRLRGVNMQAELKRMMGQEVRFRGVQEATLQAIIGGKSRILSIMGTGSGKSLTFMLPATFQGAGTTIVVVPMTSLRADMKRRCDELGIECVEWDSRKPAEKASVVLVTPESVPRKGFRGFLNRLRGMHRLERIVIDECHVVLDGREDFRPKLLALREVMSIGCQVVMLTATMPPTEEEEFTKRMGLIGFELATFRAPTTRRNIAYTVEEYDGSDEAAAAEIQVRQEQLHETGGKMIVYARTRDQVERLAQAVGQPSFHGKMADTEKRRVLGQFSSGAARVVVATNALGMGIDIGDVRTVLHIEAPDSLRYYSQESGRAGRDGKRSVACILRRRKPAREGQEGPMNIYARTAMNIPGRAEMEAFVAGQTCRRVVLDEYLDGGKERRACGGTDGRGEELCDVCASRQSREERAMAEEKEAKIGEEEEEEEARCRAAREEWDTERLREQSRARTSEVAAFEGRLRKMVEEWNGRCAICKIAGRAERGLRHPTHQCVNETTGGVKEGIEKMRRRFRSGRFAGCVGCGLPQGICERWMVTAKGFETVPGARCQARYVLIDVVVAMVFASRREQERQRIVEWMESEGVDSLEEEQIYDWYGRAMRIGEVETNRLTKVFLDLVTVFQEAPGQFRGE